MAQIPSGQKFHTVPAGVQTVERGSALANSQREIYTMQDIVDTLPGKNGIHGFIKPESISFNGLINCSISSVVLTQTAQTANRISAYPFIPATDMTSASLIINVSTSSPSSLGRIAIYSNNNGLPSELLYQSTNIDCSTTGDKTITTSFTFNAGTIYWLAFHSSGTQTVRSLQQQATIPVWFNTTTLANQYYRDYTFSSGAPNPFNPDNYTYNTIPCIFIKL